MDTNLNYGQHQQTSNPLAGSFVPETEFERFKTFAKLVIAVPKTEVKDSLKK